MNIIDTHQHFWKYDPVNYNWIDDSMQVIQKDFLPADLAEVYQQNNISGSVAVEAHQSEEETIRLLHYADTHSFIRGVVGYTDIMAANLEERLIHFSAYRKLKGFRVVLQAQEPSFMLQPAFLNGIGKLAAHGFTYDLLLFPKHLPAALELVKQFPQQRFVIDHLAKPFIKTRDINDWQKDMEAIAQCPNVFCKISGMVTEADWNGWTASDMQPYIDVVVNNFGTGRLMYGSDWPVCLVASGYQRWLQTVKQYFSDYTVEQQAQVFYKNAIQFYNL